MSFLEFLPEQKQFMNSDSSLIAYVGGIGAGKTFIACAKAIRESCKNRRQLIVSMNYTQCKTVVLDTILEILTEYFGMEEKVHFRVNRSSDLGVKIRGKARIYLRSAQNPASIRGMNVADCYMDEAAFYKTDEVYNVLLGRMRKLKKNQKGHIHITSSPNGFNWVYDLVKPYIDREKPSKRVEYIKVSSFKNSFLPDSYLVDMIRQYSNQFLRQELYADFVQMSSGLFSSEWIKDGSELPLADNVKRVRFWDLAFGDDKKSDYAAGVLLAKHGTNYIIEDIIRVRQKYNVLRKTIINTAIADGRDVIVGLENAGQQKGIIDDIFTDSSLSMFIKRSVTVSKYGHKMKRILPFACMAEKGYLYMKSNCRNKSEFYNEINGLTMDDTHLYDDMADAGASGYILLNDRVTVKGHRDVGIY